MSSSSSTSKDSSPVNLVNMPYIPDDLLLNCFVRVSRLYYPILSLVSKRFRSLLASTELYETRTLLGRSENCLYVCLRYPYETNPRWFTLCRRPTRILNPNPNYKLSDYLMVPVQTPTYFPCWRNFTVIGYNIYVTGGYTIHVPSSRVFFMDCRSHTWHEAPSMRVARKFPYVNVLDGKIYVVGGTDDFSNWIECFNPDTQTWEHIPSPGEEVHKRCVITTLEIEGKLSVVQDTRVSSCVIIDNVVYRYGPSESLQWYDSERESWRFLKGLETTLPKPPKGCYVKLVGYSGKIAVLWEDFWGDTTIGLKKIWCAEISLKRRDEDDEIYGKVEWCDVVITVPKFSYVMKLIAVNV